MKLGPLFNPYIFESVTGARQGSFSHQGSWYHVETRARVIVFDIAAFEANRALHRRSSSLVPHSVDHPSRSLSREHFGLMSWPEQFYKPRQHHQNPEGTDQQATNLSARAMQLSVFGSMVHSVYLFFNPRFWSNFLDKKLEMKIHFGLKNYLIHRILEQLICCVVCPFSFIIFSLSISGSLSAKKNKQILKIGGVLYTCDASFPTQTRKKLIYW